MKAAALFRSAIVADITSMAAIIFGGIQIIRPELKNTSASASLNVPPEVEAILRTSCYDCHSNEAKLTWFDQVAPAYWLVASDIKNARRHLNFSELAEQPAAQQTAALYDAVNKVQFDVMPPKSYRLAHPEAKLAPGQLAVLKSYLESLNTHQPSERHAVESDGIDYASWTGAAAPAIKVQPAPNGIEFPAGYKDWKVISSTNREDNHSIREVLGNDVAIQAIAAGQINPWPDGAIFAKVAWAQSTDPQGATRAGDFKQVEFMIKDSRKYAGTLGWGFARWLGSDLQPFGNSSGFTASCVECHSPLRANDFVFTTPLKSHP